MLEDSQDSGRSLVLDYKLWPTEIFIDFLLVWNYV